MLVTNQPSGLEKLKGLHLLFPKWVSINLWMIKQLRTLNLSLVRFIDQGVLKNKPKFTKQFPPIRPYQNLGISATIHITLFDDHTLSFKTNGECCDLAATLATVMLERPEFNEIYENAQKIIAHYQAENN